MIIKGERTGKYEYTAWTIHNGNFVVITKNARSFREMAEQIMNHFPDAVNGEMELIFNDYTDENGERKIPKEL